MLTAFISIVLFLIGTIIVDAFRGTNGPGVTLKEIATKIIPVYKVIKLIVKIAAPAAIGYAVAVGAGSAEGPSLSSIAGAFQKAWDYPVSVGNFEAIKMERETKSLNITNDGPDGTPICAENGSTDIVEQIARKHYNLLGVTVRVETRDEFRALAKEDTKQEVEQIPATPEPEQLEEVVTTTSF